jgi:DNA excision repair protein ERCC-2
VRLVCLDPSAHLGPRIAQLGGFVGCSATLAPHDFYQRLLGLTDDTARLDVPSPFPPERRRVLLSTRVSTRFEDRARHADATAALLSRAAAAVPGNVAIYFPSFAMLDDLMSRFEPGDAVVVAQRPGLDDAGRAATIAALAPGGTRTVLAAVLGGIFAEGVDLPPGALSAVFIVGPALPPVGLERDLLRAHFEERFGAGFRYASLVPGLTRVVQASGRLHRRPEDRGVILLVDRRFRFPEYQALLPEAWAPENVDEPSTAIAAFFAEEA